jgi:hypothetical protein
MCGEGAALTPAILMGKIRAADWPPDHCKTSAKTYEAQTALAAARHSSVTKMIYGTNLRKGMF